MYNMFRHLDSTLSNRRITMYETLICQKCHKEYIHKGGTTKKYCMNCYQKWNRANKQYKVLQEHNDKTNGKNFKCKICNFTTYYASCFDVCCHIDYPTPIILCRNCQEIMRLQNKCPPPELLNNIDF